MHQTELLIGTLSHIAPEEFTVPLPQRNPLPENPLPKLITVSEKRLLPGC